MKYKVGDKVRVKSLEWYNMNKDEFGKIRCNTAYFQPTMTKLCDSILTIKNIDKFINAYIVEENSNYWTDDMLEGLAEEEIYDEDDIDPLHELCQSKFSAVIIEPDVFKDEVELILNDYEIEVRGDKTYAVKKKPKYPKTFIEVLNFWHPGREIEDDYQRCYKKELIENFQSLLYARDAYWKIAGEEMGLGKPWKQDYNDRCFIIVNNNGNIHHYEYHGNNNVILAFPTEEMRDAFYKNFKELIEKCKELL